LGGVLLRKTPSGLLTAGLLTAALLLAACDTSFLSPASFPDETGTAPGTGRVRVDVQTFGLADPRSETEGPQRTVFPGKPSSPLSYKYYFNRPGQSGAPSKAPEANGEFILETGDWNLTVEAYLESGFTNMVATGSASFTVSQDAPATGISVDLDPIRGGPGTGDLSFTITYPSGATFDVLSWVSLSSTASDVDLTLVPGYASSPPVSSTVTTGSKAGISAGQYLITARMKDAAGVKTAGKNEVVHIYQNLPTTVAFTFGESDFTPSSNSIIIVFDEPGDANVYNQWVGNVNYTLTDSEGNLKNLTPPTLPKGALSNAVSLSVIAGDILVLEEVTPNVSFRSWRQSDDPLVENVAAHVTAMPSMDAFTKAGSAGTEAGEYFFYGFNNGGSLTSLPEGSFDIRNITTADSNFFKGFNYGGALTSLPAGSFDIRNITTVDSYFFYDFNYGGALTELPAGSFNTSRIHEVVSNFFTNFNRSGALTELPEDSFDTSSIEKVGGDFFKSFNYGGALESLPAGSFDTSSIDTIGGGFFDDFNSGGGKLRKVVVRVVNGEEELTGPTNKGIGIEAFYWDADPVLVDYDENFGYAPLPVTP
jgi:hypothetical protein